MKRLLSKHLPVSKNRTQQVNRATFFLLLRRKAIFVNDFSVFVFADNTKTFQALLKMIFVCNRIFEDGDRLLIDNSMGRLNSHPKSVSSERLQNTILFDTLHRERADTKRYPLRGTDMDEEFEDWGLTELRERVRLVQSLDQLADRMVAQAIHLCRSYEVAEKTIFVPKTQKVLISHA